MLQPESYKKEELKKHNKKRQDSSCQPNHSIPQIGGILLDKVQAVIDLNEDALYIVKNGKLTKVNKKEHGQDIVIWKHGQVLDIDRSQRLRINGQEEI